MAAGGVLLSGKEGRGEVGETRKGESLQGLEGHREE